MEIKQNCVLIRRSIFFILLLHYIVYMVTTIAKIYEWEKCVIFLRKKDEKEENELHRQFPSRKFLNKNVSFSCGRVPRFSSSFLSFWLHSQLKHERNTKELGKSCSWCISDRDLNLSNLNRCLANLYIELLFRKDVSWILSRNVTSPRFILAILEQNKVLWYLSNITY